ncbi:MAG TPA: alkaline phosphatase family protein [Pyrinomonadaceae bacterium]|nr:alkaline phosphatase family protein [Pyrinomonadaceae bacterium]
MPKKIEHLVVLMMENRSFDHMFGFLKSSSWPIDGLKGDETNPDSQGAVVKVTQDAQHAGDFNPDPPHDFLSVNQQIFGNLAGTGTPTMQGFVKAYEGKTKNVKKSHNVMKCFAPGQLPNLQTLAQQYAVCDRWFASVPGPTLPNRAFSIGATSLGRVDMNPNYLALKTIFQLLDEHGVASKIYFTDFTLGLAVEFIIKRAKKFLFFFDDFRNDCKKNKLPPLSFVEPRFNDRVTSEDFQGASDQHPDHNMRLGERVINDVYEAITSNKQTFESTLLLITYDEHGGLYDHVPPPETVNPGDKPIDSTLFDFKRLGVRVPAVLISPFIKQGTIIHDKIFDHTSIIATARKLFIPEWEKFPLTERDRHANTFEDCLNLSTARTDKVKFPKLGPPPPSPSAFAAAATDSASGSFGLSSDVAEKKPGEPDTIGQLGDFQQAMIFQAVMADRLLPGEIAASNVTSMSNELEAADYLEQVRKCVEATRDGDRNGADRKPVKAKKTAKARKTSTKTTKKKAATKKR